MDKKPHFVTELVVVQEPSPVLASEVVPDTAINIASPSTELTIESLELSSATTAESVGLTLDTTAESADVSRDATVESVAGSLEATAESVDVSLEATAVSIDISVEETAEAKHLSPPTAESVDVSTDTTAESIDHSLEDITQSKDLSPDETVQSVDVSSGKPVETVHLSFIITTESKNRSCEFSNLTNKDSINFAVTVEEILTNESAENVEVLDEDSTATLALETESYHGIVELASSYQSSSVSNDIAAVEDLTYDSSSSVDGFYCQSSVEEIMDLASDSDIVALNLAIDSAMALEESFFGNSERLEVKRTECCADTNCLTRKRTDTQSENPTAFFIPYMATLPPPPTATLIRPLPAQQNFWSRLFPWAFLRQVPWGAPFRHFASILRTLLGNILTQGTLWGRVLIPSARPSAVLNLNEDVGRPIVNGSTTVATRVEAYDYNSEQILFDQMFDAMAKSTESLDSGSSNWETLNGSSDGSLSVSSNSHMHDSESDVDELEDLEETAALPHPIIDAPADDLEGVDESDVCKVCFCRRVARKAFVPCGHAQLCAVCISAYDPGLNCPICRRKIMMIITVY